MKIKESNIEFNSDVSRGEGRMYFDYRHNPERVFLVSEKFNTEFEIDEKVGEIEYGSEEYDELIRNARAALFEIRKKGLFDKYVISRTDGKKIDSSNKYFLLKLEGLGDKKHIAACRKAILVYAEEIRDHLPELAKELNGLYNTEPVIDNVSLRAKLINVTVFDFVRNFVKNQEFVGDDLSGFPEKIIKELKDVLDIDTSIVLDVNGTTITCEVIFYDKYNKTKTTTVFIPKYY